MSEFLGRQCNEEQKTFFTSLNETIKEIGNADFKSLDFVVDFFNEDKQKKRLAEQTLVNVKAALELYAQKRRGDEVELSFEAIKHSAYNAISGAVALGVTLEASKLPAFSQELLDEYVSVVDGVACMKESVSQVIQYVYYKQWWKSIITESVLSNDFVLATSIDCNFVINQDLLEESQTEPSFYIKSGNLRESICEEIEFVKAGHSLNASANPSWIKRLDAGQVAIVDVNACEKKLEFAGGLLEGSYTATRKDENSDFWKIVKNIKKA